MDLENRIAELFETLGLDPSKREELTRMSAQGPLQMAPEQPANFRLDCSTLAEDQVAELA